MICLVCGLPGCAGHHDPAAAPQFVYSTGTTEFRFPSVGRESWECRRCRAVNAPHVDRCSCAPALSTPKFPISPDLPPSDFTPWWPAPGTFA